MALCFVWCRSTPNSPTACRIRSFVRALYWLTGRQQSHSPASTLEAGKGGVWPLDAPAPTEEDYCQNDATPWSNDDRWEMPPNELPRPRRPEPRGRSSGRRWVGRLSGCCWFGEGDVSWKGVLPIVDEGDVAKGKSVLQPDKNRIVHAPRRMFCS